MTPRTTRVRILVAVDPAGNWSGFGMPGDDYVSAKRNIYIDDLEEGERYYWVEADVPVPEIETVTGRVVE